MYSKINHRGNVIEIYHKKNLLLKISLYRIKNTLTCYNNLVNELVARKLSYSFYISKRDLFLLLYSFENSAENSETDHDIYDNFISNYTEKIENINDYINLNKIKKIKEKNDLIQIFYDDNEVIYYELYMLRLKQKKPNLSSDLVKYLITIAKLGFFDIIVSQRFTSQDKYKKNNWGVMLFSQNKSETELLKKHRHFMNFITRKIKSFNVDFVKITKKDIGWNLAKFQLLLPWERHLGDISFQLSFDSIFEGTRYVEDLNLVQGATDDKSKKENRSPPIINERPLPSIKELNKSLYVTEDEQFEYSENNNTGTSIIETIPKIGSINYKSDKITIRKSIVNIFKTEGYNESLIFNNKFDVVLRKGTSYIFVVISLNSFLPQNAYDLVEELSGIVGLRNNFLTVVIAPVFEAQSAKILREHNIIMINTSECLNEEMLKNALYEKTSGIYAFLPISK